MVVKTEYEGCGVAALDVGAANVLRYFPAVCTSVELQLGDLSISCKLAPDFWKDRPKICDPRLCSWLEFKVHYRSPRRMPVSLALIPNGSNAFRIEPLPIRSSRRDGSSKVKFELTNTSMDAPQGLEFSRSSVYSSFPPQSAVPDADDSLEVLQLAAS